MDNSTTYQGDSFQNSTDDIIRLSSTTPPWLTQQRVQDKSLDVATNTSQSDGFSAGITILYVCGESTIALLIVVGNSLVLRAIHSERKLQTFTNCFVASLAVADLLVGVVGIPSSLVAFFGHPPGFVGCLFVNTLIIILTQISIFGLVTISLERYVAIRYPFFYQQHSSKKTALVAIVTSWSLAIVVGMVPIMGWNLRATYDAEYCNFTDVVSMEYMVFFNFLGFVLAPLVLMFCLYAYIYVIVRQQMKRMAQQHFNISPSPENSKQSNVYSVTSHTKLSTTNLNETAQQPTFGRQHKVKIFQNGVQDSAHAQATAGCELVSIHVQPRAHTEKPYNLPPMARLTSHLTPVTNVTANGGTPCGTPKLLRRQQNGQTQAAKARKKFIESFRKELRAAKWFAIVICVFAVCWLPIHVMNTVSLLHEQVASAPVIVAIILSHANSAINPVLYAYSNSKFKAVMLALVTCSCRQQQRASTSDTLNNSAHNSSHQV